MFLIMYKTQTAMVQPCIIRVMNHRAQMFVFVCCAHRNCLQFNPHYARLRLGATNRAQYNFSKNETINVTHIRDFFLYLEYCRCLLCNLCLRTERTIASIYDYGMDLSIDIYSQCQV